jgi:hypothetical protein
MHVSISTTGFEAPNTREGVETLFTRIEQELDSLQLYFDYLVVDGAVVTDDPQGFIETHLDTVENIEVHFFAADQYLAKIIEVLQAFLDNALPAIAQMAAEFYGKPGPDTWGRFDTALDGMKSLIGLIQGVMNDASLANKLDEISSLGASLQDNLATLLDAVQRGDNTLVADVLTYEILPFFENLLKAVRNLSERHTNAVN